MKNNIKIFAVVVSLAFLVVTLPSCKCDSPSQNSKKKIAVLQLVSHPVIDSIVSGFQKNISDKRKEDIDVVVYNANGDTNMLSIMSKQMVASNADVIVSVTTPASSMLIGNNRGRKPLVFSFVSLPQSLGYEDTGSIKNTTGLSDRVNYEKTLQMIKAMKPDAKKIGYLLTRSEDNAVEIHSQFSKLAPKFDLEILTTSIGTSLDVKVAAESLATRQIDAFLFGGDNTVASGIDALIITGLTHKIPVFACDEESVKRGAIAAYSVNYNTMGAKTADICISIIDGKQADTIPLTIFDESQLFVNAKSARALQIDVPDIIQREIYRLLED